MVDVTNPTTGKTWMDRNLGASRVATSFNDALAYGGLYQWGRCYDGHEERTSGTTTTLSTSNIVGHNNFILSASAPRDWITPQNDLLWQGVNGLNNPCPAGYRLPTEAELNSERLSWASNNRAGAFGSPLKLPAGGYRHDTGPNPGSIKAIGNDGDYWTSTIVGTDSRLLFFNPNSGFMANYDSRAGGVSVRCIKD